MAGLVNGSGSPKDDFLHFPSRGFDVSRSSVPIAVAIAASLAIAGCAFQVGKLFSRYEIERGEILERLDKIERKIDRIVPGGLAKHLRKSREAGSG